MLRPSVHERQLFKIQFPVARHPSYVMEISFSSYSIQNVLGLTFVSDPLK